MFSIKFRKIAKNIVSKTLIPGIKGFPLIEHIYNKFVEQIKVSYLKNIKFLNKEDF